MGVVVICLGGGELFLTISYFIATLYLVRGHPLILSDFRVGTMSSKIEFSLSIHPLAQVGMR